MTLRVFYSSGIAAASVESPFDSLPALQDERLPVEVRREFPWEFRGRGR